MHSFDFSRIESLMSTMPQRGIPCAELAVTYRGETVYRVSVGCADAEGKVPLGPQHLYPLFSCTKIATCTAAMKLLEEGKMGLEDPVSRYLPAFEKLYVREGNSLRRISHPLRIWHLFTMTGGFNYSYDGTVPLQNVIRVKGFRTRDFVDALAQGPLDFEPGTHFQYSLCHDVLGAVVEAVSGLSLGEYMKRVLFDPLGMSDTTFHPNAEQKSRMTQAFRFDFPHGTAVPCPDTSDAFIEDRCAFESGGAGLVSKTDDYIRLMTMLANGGRAPDGTVVLRPETIAQMQVNRLPENCRYDFMSTRLFGYGWGLCGRVHVNPALSLSRSSVGEFGWDGAAAPFALADPEKKVALYFGTHVHHCNYAYHVLHPLIRDYTYEGLGF